LFNKLEDSMLSVESFKINSKELTVIGEIHIYNKKESKLAELLLNEKRFDVAFLEKAPLGKTTRAFHSLLFKILSLLTLRYHKSLRKMVSERRIPCHELEKETNFPLFQAISFNVLTVLLLIGLIIPLITKSWKALIGYIIFINVYIQILASNLKLGRYLPENFSPTNKRERDKTMSENLKKFISEVDFNRGVVIVGNSHFSKIVEAVNEVIKE